MEKVSQDGLALKRGKRAPQRKGILAHRVHIRDTKKFMRYGVDSYPAKQECRKEARFLIFIINPLNMAQGK